MEANLQCRKKSLLGKVLVCMFFLVFLLVPLSCEAKKKLEDGWSMKKLEAQKLLKSLNKPPVKSIKSIDGDVIDCVNILHQSAFDHPDLKNHKIQMRPNFYPKGVTFDVSNVSSNSKLLRQLWHKSGRCPKGTVPIRRTKKDDILRANSIEKFGKKEKGSFPLPKSAQPTPNIANSNENHEYAAVYVGGEKYFGGKAIMNIWNPKIEQPDEFSLSQIWAVAGTDKNKNSIEAGWMVYPKLLGDNRTRLFTYWTRDAYTSTGCYNHLCPGFVQISKDITMGGSFNPISIYGSSQYQIDIMIWMDPGSKNWWLRVGNNDVGYWPASLFTYLKDYASFIRWGGEISNSQSNGHHTTTQMGSGHFPREGFGKASYFNKLEIVTGVNVLIGPTKLITFTSKKRCYGIGTARSKFGETFFYYGGPGRNINCP